MKSLFARSVVTASLGFTLLVIACSETSTAENDAGSGGDSATGDASTDASNDGTTPAIDANLEAGRADAKADGPALPPLCDTYPDSFIAGTSYPTGGEMRRWQKIAFESAQGGAETCGITAWFGTLIGGQPAHAGEDGAPFQTDCLYQELRELIGCKDQTGKTFVYSALADRDSNFCAPPTGSRVLLGFRNPQANGITTKDVETYIGVIRTKAQANGLAAEDAARLESLLLERKAEAIAVQSNQFSNKCDGG